MKKDGFTTGKFRKASSSERGTEKVGYAKGWEMDKSGSSQPTEASKAEDATGLLSSNQK